MISVLKSSVNNHHYFHSCLSNFKTSLVSTVMCPFSKCKVLKVAKVEKQADVKRKNWLEISVQRDLADGCGEWGSVYVLADWLGGWETGVLADDAQVVTGAGTHWGHLVGRWGNSSAETTSEVSEQENRLESNVMNQTQWWHFLRERKYFCRKKDGWSSSE